MQKKHGLVNTKLFSLLFIDTIIYLLHVLPQCECSVVYRRVIVCWNSLTAQQDFTLAVGRGPIPRSLLYHPLSSMWVYHVALSQKRLV